MSYWAYPGTKDRNGFLKAVRQASVQDFAVAVAKHFNLTLAELKRRNRTDKFVVPRQICMYLCRMNANIKVVSIASFFKMHHTTVIYSIKQVNNMIETDELDVSDHIKEIIEEFYSTINMKS